METRAPTVYISKNFAVSSAERVDDDFQLNAKNLMTGERVTFLFLLLLFCYFFYILGFLGRLISL